MTCSGKHRTGRDIKSFVSHERKPCNLLKLVLIRAVILCYLKTGLENVYLLSLQQNTSLLLGLRGVL